MITHTDAFEFKNSTRAWTIVITTSRSSPFFTAFTPPLAPPRPILQNSRTNSTRQTFHRRPSPSPLLWPNRDLTSITELGDKLDELDNTNVLSSPSSTLSGSLAPPLHRMSAILGSDSAPSPGTAHSDPMKRKNEPSTDDEADLDGQSPPPAKRRPRATSSRKNWTKAEEKLLVDLKNAGESWPTIAEQLRLRCGTVRGSEGCKTHFYKSHGKPSTQRDNDGGPENQHYGESSRPPATREEELQHIPMAGDGFQRQSHAYDLVDDLLHHGDILQRVHDLPQPSPIPITEAKINHALLGRAADDVAGALPDTPKFYYIVAAVARSQNYAQTAEREAELMAQVGLDLKRGAHRSVFLAIQYEKLCGQSVYPHFLEGAMEAIDSARSGKSQRWVEFCMWVHEDYMPVAEIEAVRMMDRKNRMAKRRADIAAGKLRWLCVAERYDELLEEHNESLKQGR